MTLYDEMQSLTKEILGEFKQGVIRYARITPGNGPVDDPGASTKTFVGIDGVSRGVKFKYVAQGLADASDLQMTTHGALSFNPDLKDMIEIDGVEYKIRQILPKPSAGTPVAYVFILKR